MMTFIARLMSVLLPEPLEPTSAVVEPAGAVKETFSPLQSAKLEAAATSLQSTPMQVALAWLLERSSNILLIPGTSSVEHLRENLKAATLQLPPKIIANLDSIG